MPSVNNADSNNSIHNLNIKSTLYVWFCGVTATLTSFVAGFNAAAPTPKPVMRYWSIDDDDESSCPYELSGLYFLDVGTFGVGCLLGGIAAGPAASKYGYKWSLLFTNFFFIAGIILVANATTVVEFIVSRIVVGIACGTGLVITPAYITEISTNAARSIQETMSKVFMVIGIVAANCASIQLTSELDWKYLFGIAIFPPLLQIMLLPVCLDVPSHLFSQKKTNDAGKGSKAIYKGSMIEAESNEKVTTACDESSKDNYLNLDRVLKNKHIRCLCEITITMQSYTRYTCAANMVFFSPEIFNNILSIENTIYLAVSLAIVNLVFSLSIIVLSDKVEKKALLYTSGIGMCVLMILAHYNIQSKPNLEPTV